MNLHKLISKQLNLLKDSISSPSPEFKLVLRSLLINTLPGGAVYTELATYLCEYIFDKKQESKEAEFINSLERLQLSHHELLTLLSQSLTALNMTAIDQPYIKEVDSLKQSTSPNHQHSHISQPRTQQDNQPQEIRVEDQQLKMCLCPSGTFWMGSDCGVGDLDEQPKHQVVISQDFMMSETLITQGFWQTIMNTSPGRYWGHELRPVESISWFEALIFCNRLSLYMELQPVYELNISSQTVVSIHHQASGYRLPTEAEWEYAAKASADFIDEGLNSLNQTTLRELYPSSVKRTPPNLWGLYNMTGFLWVWCIDYMSRSAYKERAHDLVIDPIQLHFSKQDRVIRGGSWDDPEEMCRVTIRHSEKSTTRSPLIGLRIAQTKL